jgi:hypothetical protein
MFPDTRPHLVPSQPQPASPAITVSPSASETTPVRAIPVALAVPAKREAKVATANAARPAPKAEADATSRRGGRPGFLLNDAQIASIRTRLHLTPDQESMWPAVEAALDPDSDAVQGLKSAAVPLIMSFSEEQKSEVRNLAHVMGLDKLASEF